MVNELIYFSDFKCCLFDCFSNDIKWFVFYFFNSMFYYIWVVDINIDNVVCFINIMECFGYKRIIFDSIGKYNEFCVI